MLDKNKPTSTALPSVSSFSNISVTNRLKKIYLLEKMKHHYLVRNSFKSYKKACFLQERILKKVRSPQSETNSSAYRNPITRALAQKINQQMMINQNLLDEIKAVTVDVWGVVSGYYNPEGEVNKRSLKLFSTNA